MASNVGIQVSLNVEDMFGEFSEFFEGIEKTINKALAVEFYRVLNNTAFTLLDTHEAERYMSGVELTEDSISVSGYAEEMEKGTPAYDMKEGFRNSSKAKRTKDGGWYLTIPLSLKTPGKRKGGTIIPRSIYRAIRKGIQYNLPESGSRQAFTDPVTNRLFEEYRHKHSIYEGIVQTKTPGGYTKYNTFRRVSDKSNPASWIRKGKPPVSIIDFAFGELNADAVVSQFI